MATDRIQIGVLLGDPTLPYPYAMDGKFGEEETRAIVELKSALASLEGYEFIYFDDHSRLIDDLRSQPPDLMLNFCDAGYRNNWEQERNVPALLEIFDVRYTGANAMAIDLSTDKAIVRWVATSLAIPVPNETYIDLTADPIPLPSTYPSLIKPNSSGGSFGITEESVVHDAAEAEAYLHGLVGQLETPEAVAQDFLTGTEYTVGLVGNHDTGFTVLSPLEVDYSRLEPDLPPILTYSSKADPESAYWNKLDFQKASVDEVTRAQMVEHCAALFRRLGFRDYARFDFRCGSDGLPRLLDANTNPTWYWDGKMAIMAGWSGYDYAAFLRLILEAAEARYGFADPESDHLEDMTRG